MRVSKDNKSQERKLRMGITMKLNLIVIVPVLIISIVSIVQSYMYQNKTVTQMYENEMVAAAQTLNNMMNAVDSGDYSYDGTTYYKGDTELTGLSEYVKNVKEESDVSLAFFYGTEVVFTAADESRPLEDATYTKLVNDGAFSKDNVSIGEDSCYCYFVPITQPGTSEVIGAICVNAPKTDIQDMIMNNVIKIIITVVIVTVIVACIGVYISIKLAQALKKASEGMIKISDGNLDFDLDSKLLHRKDEVGEIASSLSKVLVRFKSMLIAIKDSSDNLETFTGDFRESFMSITNNIGSVNTAVNEIADGATSQAQETQNANSQIIEIGNSIDTTLDEANELDKRSRIMKDYSSNAKDTLSELNVINQKTKESITTVKVQTDITNKSAQNIREALSIINNIADQTNLLSLNASIEAARAGDAGKGFAVVADEIRNLSEQSTKSVQDIEDIINTLLSNSEISVNAMNDVNLIIEDQSSKLSDTDNMFKALLTEVDEVISGIEKIKNEVDNLNNKKSQICDSIESLSSIAEENAAGTEETSATMLSLGDIITGCKEETDKLVELSNNLQDGMSKFKF